MRDDRAARDAQIAAEALAVDADRSNIIVSIGRKGSGKSEFCRQIFDAWPYDRVVIDVTGDARPEDPGTVVLTAPVPVALPAPAEGQRRVTAWARMDPRRTTYLDDQDDALGLALHPRHRNTLVWVDEYAQMTPNAQTMGPNLRLALQSSRHYHCSMLLAFPRPRYVPVLTLAQADLVAIFMVPDRADRELVAKNIGYPFPKFEAHYRETMRRGAHSFLLWDAQQHVLIGCPALPAVKGHGPRA